ncbi:baculovirus fp protein [Holotrichia oblita]|uniref:Baculovirus fp protein n=1 Tax=Holotrichia oblita TaxID=644536 RepID=A0ACB9TEC6_HOLOL|nr:baculovirus fp protein [Holotrichia oblita]
MGICKTCSAQIKRASPSLRCVQCSSVFHPNCVEVPPDNVRYLSLSGVSWKCPSCRGCNYDFASRGDEGAEIGATGESKMDEILKFFQLMRTDVKQLRSDYGNILKSVRFCSDKISDFEASLKSVNEKVKDAPESTNKNVLNVVNSIATFLKVPLTENDIDAVHRVPVPPNKPKEIAKNIVKFVARRKRDELLAAGRLHKRNSATAGIDVPNISPGLFINEHLTREKKKLFREVRSAAKEKQYKYVWVRNGSILVRKYDKSKELGSQPLPTITADDIEGSIPRPRSGTWGSKADHKEATKDKEKRKSKDKAKQDGKSKNDNKSENKQQKDKKKDKGSRSGSASRSSSAERRKSVDELQSPKKPGMLDVLRGRSGSDASKKKGLALMMTMFHTNKAKTPRDGSAHPVKDGPHTQYYHTVTAASTSRSPMTKVMDIFRNRPHSNLADDKRKISVRDLEDNFFHEVKKVKDPYTKRDWREGEGQG